MATSMCRGASFGRSPESLAKKAKNGTLIPALWKTPAEAKSKQIQTTVCP